jgi:hypothetical protein
MLQDAKTKCEACYLQLYRTHTQARRTLGKMDDNKLIRDDPQVCISVKFS